MQSRFSREKQTIERIDNINYSIILIFMNWPLWSVDRRNNVPQNPQLPWEPWGNLVVVRKPKKSKSKPVIHDIQKHIHTLFTGAVENLPEDSKKFFQQFDNLTQSELATSDMQKYLIVSCRKNPDIAPEDTTLRWVLSKYLYMPVDEANALKRMRDLVVQRLNKSYIPKKNEQWTYIIDKQGHWWWAHTAQALDAVLHDKTLEGEDKWAVKQIYWIIQKYNVSTVNTRIFVNGVIMSLKSARPENYDYYIKLKYEELVRDVIRDGWKKIHRTGSFTNPLNPKNTIKHTGSMKPIGDILLPTEPGYKKWLDKKNNPEKYKKQEVTQWDLFAALYHNTTSSTNNVNHMNTTTQNPYPKDTRRPREINPEQREFEVDEDGAGRPAGRRVKKN